jgi:hypothetical protein
VKIEVLYVAGCPHLPATLARLRQVLRSHGCAERIDRIEVQHPGVARALGFRGSPTIRINGFDIAGEHDCPPVDAMACRLYPGGENPGVPPVEMIQRAVRRACEEGGN